MMEQTVKGGYGVQILYDLRPDSGESLIKTVAKGLYGEDAVHSGINYGIDW